jgi:hypothetical protein
VAESSPVDTGSPPVAANRLNQAGLLALLVAVSIVVGYLAVSLVLTLAGAGTGLSVDACLAKQPPGHVTGPPLQPPSPLLDPPIIHWSGIVVIACLVAFIAGNTWGRRRALGQAEAADRSGGTLGPPSTLLQVVLVGLFVVGTGALVWETIALARVQDQPDLWPITFYVRCANDVLSLPTLVGAVLVSAMVGHLLGYQARAGETD